MNNLFLNIVNSLLYFVSNKTKLFVLLLFVATSCATIVAPSGGPVDKQAPQVVSYSPQDKSLNFDSKKIVITFDEFINLQNADKQIFISPPFKNAPDYKVKRKSLQININDTLFENTTYTVFFGDAISDITENNKVSNLVYSFSTGDYIDTLSVWGHVLDAYTQKPVKDALVMLYTDFNDSVPLTSLPRHISKTNDDGSFHIQNLKAGEYKIFALNDLNNDYKCNLLTESLAFSLDTIKPRYFGNNSLGVDTAKEIKLMMFTTKDTVQHIVESKIIDKNKVRFIFKEPTEDFDIRANFFENIDKQYHEWSNRKDTLMLWLPSDVDTATFYINTNKTISDTITFKGLVERETEKPKGKSKSQAVATPRLKYSSTVSSGMLPFYKPVEISFKTPIAKVFNSNYLLIDDEKADTVQSQFTVADTLFRKLTIDLPKPLSSVYTIVIPDSSYTDIYNVYNDSIKLAFSVSPAENYGSLKLNISSKTTQNIIVNILDAENDNLVRSVKAVSNSTIDLGYFNPKTYRAIVIFDINNNGIWDCGDYFKKIYPEPTFIFPKELKIRANWDLEEDWLIE
ncbi:MAG: Ig-like domain-containing protein [Lentimicrobiaceae bacterium]|nr:Ig-like domain-containing protein [Lentimicrobiaceae bacterium]